MNENINETTDKANDSSIPIRGKAVQNYMAQKKQAIEEVVEDAYRSNGAAEEEQAKLISTSAIPAPPVLENKPKEANRKKRTVAVDYSEHFLGRYELNSRQGLHVEKETIATIKRVVHGIGDPRLTVSGFVENVLKHHFEIYKEDINSLFELKLRKPID